jgi:hypothetical protein
LSNLIGKILKNLKYVLIIFLIIQSISFAQNETVYEDAEDGTTDRWSIYDNDPAGASIDNVYDSDKSSRVIELNGTLDDNGFVLSDDGSWDYMSNTSQFTAQWSMKTSEDFRVYFYINTSAGEYYLVYDKSDVGTTNVSGNEIYYGLGSDAKNGSWNSFERDLKSDFESAVSDESISEVKTMLLRINGRIDDVKLKDDSALPVELTTFSAMAKNNKVEIEWETATEVNNYGFNIERALLNKNDWEKIGFVEGYGNSNSIKHYRFVDDHVSSGKYYYRLKQIDIDGKFKYSKMVEVNLEFPGKYELSQNYPNPFNPATTIQYTIPLLETLHTTSQRVLLKVYNILGKEVATLVNKQQAPGVYKVIFDGTNLPSGIHFYTLQVGNFIQTKRMILLK